MLLMIGLFWFSLVRVVDSCEYVTVSVQYDTAAPTYRARTHHSLHYNAMAPKEDMSLLKFSTFWKPISAVDYIVISRSLQYNGLNPGHHNVMAWTRGITMS